MATDKRAVRNIGALERAFNADPSRERLYALLDAYLERSDAKSLDKALSLSLRTLKQYEDDPALLERSAYVLSLIKGNPSAYALAGSLTSRLVELQPDEPGAYGKAAYINWQIGNVNSAIELSEIGLAKAAARGLTDDVVLALKANAAYYYAERGLSEDADKALRLAEEAFQVQRTPSFADTLGYVILRFAKSRQDVVRAQEYFMIALEKLKEIGGANLTLEEHIRDVESRLKQAATG